MSHGQITHTQTHIPVNVQYEKDHFKPVKIYAYDRKFSRVLKSQCG